MEYARYEEPDWHARGKASESKAGSAIVWLLAGVGVGAALGLLFAPASGREIRNAIGRGCRRTLEGISRGTRQLRRRGSNLLNFKSSRAEEKIQQG
jgi:gas vesicle protein